MSTSDSIILFGGGLDSGAMVEMLTKLGARPLLLFFDYNQKALRGERRALHYFKHKHRLESYGIEIPSGVLPDSPLTTRARVDDHAQNYLPGRNMLFSALAWPVAVRLGVDRIYLGASPAPETSVYLDAKKSFQHAFNTMTKAGYGQGMPELRMPLVELDRRQYLTETLEREPNLFDVTFSCYESATETECGVCTHCLIKAEAYRDIMRNKAF